MDFVKVKLLSLKDNSSIEYKNHLKHLLNVNISKVYIATNFKEYWKILQEKLKLF